MLYSTYISQVRRELEELSESVWADASLLYWVNEAAKDLAIQTKCSRDWMYTTTLAGTSVYLIPDYSLEVIEVYFGDSSTAGDRKKLIRQDFTEWPTIDVGSGTPLYYAIDDQYIYLRPTPDTAEELSFLRYSVPEPLTGAGTDAMPFSDRYNTAITYYVKSKAYEQALDFSTADALLGRYNAEVDKIARQETAEATARRMATVTSVY